MILCFLNYELYLCPGIHIKIQNIKNYYMIYLNNLIKTIIKKLFYNNILLNYKINQDIIIYLNIIYFLYFLFSYYLILKFTIIYYVLFGQYLLNYYMINLN